MTDDSKYDILFSNDEAVRVWNITASSLEEDYDDDEDFDDEEEEFDEDEFEDEDFEDEEEEFDEDEDNEWEDDESEEDEEADDDLENEVEGSDRVSVCHHLIHGANPQITGEDLERRVEGFDESRIGHSCFGVGDSLREEGLTDEGEDEEVQQDDQHEVRRVTNGSEGDADEGSQ